MFTEQDRAERAHRSQRQGGGRAWGPFRQLPAVSSLRGRRPLLPGLFSRELGPAE
jgi:hypothetical protein